MNIINVVAFAVIGFSVVSIFPIRSIIQRVVIETTIERNTEEETIVRNQTEIQSQSNDSRTANHFQYNNNNTEEFHARSLPLLPLGKFQNQHAWPYLSHDGWYDLVHGNNEHNNIVLATTWNDVNWTSYLNQRSTPIIMIMINQLDIPFDIMPSSSHPRQQQQQHYFDGTTLLDHPMLDRLYVYNPSIIHPKVHPIPIGPRWQTKSIRLFGESKTSLRNYLEEHVATSPNATKHLFLSTSNNRYDTIWVRPMSTRRHATYDRTMNRALRTPRDKICNVLQAVAQSRTVCEYPTAAAQRNRRQRGNSTNTKFQYTNANTTTSTIMSTESSSSSSSPSTLLLPRDIYWERLKQHRFVASPPGRGMDSHATWEALLAGCIPIVPHSALDSMFEDLPVWLIHSWQDEITDETIQEKLIEMTSNVDKYNWDKIYAIGWVKEIIDASRKLSSEVAK